jgi:hypothetical protein
MVTVSVTTASVTLRSWGRDCEREKRGRDESDLCYGGQCGDVDVDREGTEKAGEGHACDDEYLLALRKDALCIVWTWGGRRRVWVITMDRGGGGRVDEGSEQGL